MFHVRHLLRAAAAFALIGAGTSARAADEEIQVYLGDINAAHHFGLDVHVNDTLSGDRTPDYAGQQQSVHRIRVTPEWSYSVNSDVELGLYLPLATLDAGGHLRADGWKVRVKWLPRHPEKGLYYGINYEVGRVAYHLDQNPWNNEVKVIAGWNSDRWIIGGNVNVDFALSGPARGPAQVQLATRIGYKLPGKTVISLESYNGAGSLRDFGRLARTDHATFVSIDTTIGQWNLNAGVGKGYGTSKDDVIVKFIIGVPI